MSTIPKKQLGKDGPLVPRLGFGAMGLSAWAGEVLPDEQRFEVLDRAFELGETFWDSADIYGDSEDLIGKWFKRTGKRNEIFLATKFGGIIDGPGHRIRSDPEYVKEACRRSLERLGVDSIDLYYVHRVDRKTPIEHTVQAMAELKAEGKVKYLGLSEVSAATLRRAHAVHPITAVQVEYSPFTIDIEDPAVGVLSACRELGVAVVAYSPLAKGLVTGRYRSHADLEEEDGDLRRLMPRFSPENFARNLVLVDVLHKVAREKEGGRTSPGQLTLAWLMAQGDDIFPIPGTRKIKYLEENVGSVNVKLTPAEVAEIREAVDGADVAGDRFPKGMDLHLFADTPEL